MCWLELPTCPSHSPGYRDLIAVMSFTRGDQENEIRSMTDCDENRAMGKVMATQMCNVYPTNLANQGIRERETPKVSCYGMNKSVEVTRCPVDFRAQVTLGKSSPEDRPPQVFLEALFPPATVRPNVKSRFNTPWKTRSDLSASGSGRFLQGVPLASRSFGDGLSEPDSGFKGLELLGNPTLSTLERSSPMNAEFRESGCNAVAISQR